MRKNNINISSDWAEKLSQEFTKPYFVRLISYISEEEENFNVYPEKEIRFEALHKTSFKNTRVVIIGQDPYHAINQANGLAFSVNNGSPIPPSLKNIFIELESDLGISISKFGSLKGWAKQGVLLLNTCLTVEESKPGSHQNIGWEKFTDEIINQISLQGSMVFILWGAKAQEKESIIKNHDKNLIIKSAHPSPFSARRGFFGTKPFSRTNHFLKENGKKEINWNLDNE